MEKTVTQLATEKLQKQVDALKQSNQELRNRLDEEKGKVDVNLINLRAKYETTRNQLTGLLKKEERVKEYVAEVKLAVQALDPLPTVPYVVPKPIAQRTPMTAVMHLTDWHVGEMINPKETEGFGNFNWQIAQDRMTYFVQSYLKWLDTQRNGYNINRLAIVCTGDFVSGDIHDELRRTNEFPLPVQVAKAGSLLSWVVQQVAPKFDFVDLIEIGADNHSRLVQKPQAKQKVSNSMGYLVYEIANAYLEKHSNVSLLRSEGMKQLFKLGPFQVLGEHGDTVKSWMGVPWYGMEREKAREATRRMFEERGFHYIMMGHWHVPFFGPYIIGGSLTGTSEYDHSCGRNAKPSQTAFLVGKHGFFNFTPFELLSLG